MFSKSEFEVRQFSAADVEAYRSIRLEALQLDPGMFSSNYAKEALFTKEQWLDRVANENRASFGLYHGDELAGITGIVIDQLDSRKAHMTQSYIRAAYRGMRLSWMLYQARINWAKQKGIKKLAIGHREDNLRSKAANQHFGFRYTHRESLQWPDGTTADSLFYELEIA